MLLSSTNILLLLPVYTLALASHCQDEDLTVALRNPRDSLIKGRCKRTHQGETYYAFTDIPYAEPPVGSRRLQTAVPKRPWKGTFDATKVNTVCPQDALFGGNFPYGTEDCLVINVYTPKMPGNSSKLLPVLFYIHTGALQFGSGTHMFFGKGFLDYYDPAMFMDEEIVIVAPNYRLTSLGTLTTEDGVIPDNLYLRDTLLALKWAQDNVDLFGGDPKDIVIGGETVGAMSACYLLLSDAPEMKAVTGAIIQSGTCLTPWALSLNPAEKAFKVGRKLGINTNNSSELLRTLQSVPTQQFLRAAEMQYIPAKTDNGSFGGIWAPTFSKDFVPKEPMLDTMNKGRFHKVPLLFGTNSEEALSPFVVEFLPQVIRRARVWDEDPSKMIQNTLNVRDRRAAGENLKALYTNTSFSNDLPALIKFCTDDQFFMPMGKHAEIAAKYGVPVYMYQIDYRYVPHLTAGIEGVGHAEDLFFFFDNFISKVFRLLYPHFELISKRLVKAVSNFVKYKKPVVKREELFENLLWPEFDNKKLQYMRIDTHLSVLSDPREYSRKRKVWDKQLQKPSAVY